MTTNIRDFPKVLIVAQDSIDKFGSYGIWTSSLFRTWPREKLAQLVYQPNPTPSDESLRTRFLTRHDVPILGKVQGAFDRLSHRHCGYKSTEEYELSTRSAQGMPYRPPVASLRRKLWKASVDLFPFRISPSVQDWVREFSPEVIYSPLASSRYIRLAKDIADIANAPVFAYFHDDWLGALYADTPLTWPARWNMLRSFKMIRPYILGVGATSEAMASEYRERFGFSNCSSLMHCVDAPADCPEFQPVSEGRPIRLVYIGGLHLNRWKSLHELGLVLQQIHSEGHNIEAVIYAPENDIKDYSETLNIPPIMRIAGFLPPERMSTAIDEADIVIHVESFSPTERRYTRLSLSTKIPTYMSRARPILAYGPGEVASCRYIRDSGAGVVVGEANSNLLADGVRQLLRDTTLRQTMARKAWDTAKRNHSIGGVTERFRKSIVATAQRKDGDEVYRGHYSEPRFLGSMLR